MWCFKFCITHVESTCNTGILHVESYMCVIYYVYIPVFTKGFSQRQTYWPPFFFYQHRTFLRTCGKKLLTWIFKVKTSPSPSESMKVWVRHCDLNTTISASKLITNLNCVFISYPSQKWFDLVVITTKTLFYWANIDKNGFPGITSFSKESRALW